MTFEPARKHHWARLLKHLAEDQTLVNLSKTTFSQIHELQHYCSKSKGEIVPPQRVPLTLAGKRLELIITCGRLLSFEFEGYDFTSEPASSQLENFFTELVILLSLSASLRIKDSQNEKALMKIEARDHARKVARLALIEQVEIPRSPAVSIASMSYNAAPSEQVFVDSITRCELDDWNGAAPGDDDSLADYFSEYHGEYTAWFGIVREVWFDKEKQETHIRVEHKYFDGIVDTHLQITSIYGAGDFEVIVAGEIAEQNLPLLSLARFYGEVGETQDRGICVYADYIRYWDWGKFAFMDYGLDGSNPEWVKLRKISGYEVYTTKPNAAFYESLLGCRHAYSEAS